LANVKDLLKRGTETNITDSQGRTCLFKAVNARRTAVVEELLAYEADVNILDNEGWSPLHDATSEGLAEIVAMLLNAGASVHQRDKKGWPALHWAAYRGFGTIAGHLIKAGADPNCISWTDGWTALHFAACWRHRDVIEVLINGGADVNKASRLRKTPLDVAEDPEVMIPQDEGTVRLLKNYGGQNYQLIDNYGSHDNTRHPTQEGLDDPSTLTSDSESEGT
jgi:ankyrin repeat protein